MFQLFFSVLFLLWPNHGSSTINLLQWNPHWQCFQDPNCGYAVYNALNSLLTSKSMDFANIVELGSGYKPPSGWSKIPKVCGNDRVDLIYNNRKWSPGASSPGCMQSNPQDRAYIVQSFSSGSDKVTVIGGHYPHGSPHGLAGSVSRVGGNNILFMADTNNGGSSNADILRQIGVYSSNVQGNSKTITCCLNDGFRAGWYDRTIATFGSSMTSEMLFSPVPSAMKVGEFHKAVHATLYTNGPGPAPHPSPSPGPKPGNCTPDGSDPYQSGHLVECCSGSKKCLHQSTGWTYRCQKCNMSCVHDKDYPNRACQRMIGNVFEE